ncbi:hypothetical protein LCGC14_2223740 [marine sediment metagenome]|uniref:Uncharacterized protein n=1 Tax=marine sediment metagenome TaxID=412755 RepID=A0A0F9FMS3_9ZZZZ
MPAKDPLDAIKQDMQRTLDAFSHLNTTLQTVAGKGRSFYPPLLSADEPLRQLAQQMETMVLKAETELNEAALRFVRFDLSLFFKSG